MNRLTSCFFSIFASLCLSLLIFPTLSLAAPESICPGGSSPRGDIALCFDFDNLARCSDGREQGCWQDNGIDGQQPNASLFKIKSGEAAVGNGYFDGQGDAGGTGPGYTLFEIPGGPATAVNLRYYVKYTGGYLTYDDQDHGPAIAGDGPGCANKGHYEQSQYKYRFGESMLDSPGDGLPDCPIDTYNLYPNKPNPPVMKSNRWILIEQQKIIDTNCTNPNSAHGCNGVARLWIDEQLVMEHTDLNYGGVTNGVRFKHVFGPSSYFHAAVPEWKHRIQFDNVAISRNGTYIGPASNENPRGTADPSSPYHTYKSITTLNGRYANHNCTTPHEYLGVKYVFQWRNGGSLDASIFHDGFGDRCVPAIPDKSLKVNLTSTNSGGGFYWQRKGGPNYYLTFPQQVIHGWIYLPSGNDYSPPPALAGFFGYSGELWGNYVTLTVNNGKFALLQRHKTTQSTPVIVGTSNKSVQFNNWHEFEIIVWEDQRVSLMVDRTRLFDRHSLPQPVNWLFSGTILNGLVVGVVDFTGTPPFSVYYDDISAATVSFWSCDGWHSSSCPVSGSPPPSPAPSPTPSPSSSPLPSPSSSPSSSPAPSASPSSSPAPSPSAAPDRPAPPTGLRVDE